MAEWSTLPPTYSSFCSRSEFTIPAEAILFQNEIAPSKSIGIIIPHGQTAEANSYAVRNLPHAQAASDMITATGFRLR